MAIEQWDFLKESDTSLGLFYPLHYIIAGYADMHAAQDAEVAFCGAGVAPDDVRAALGDFIAQQLESQDEDSWLKQAQASLVKFMGTETGYLREDKNHARAGGAFLFVHAPDDDALALAKRIFESHPPIYARRYLRIAIEIVIENPNSL